MSPPGESTGHSPSTHSALAVLRLGALGLIYAATALTAPPAAPALFSVLMIAATLYATLVAAGVSTHLPVPSLPVRLCGVIDLGLLAGLAYATGGRLHAVFSLVPLGAALLARPRSVARWAAAAVIAYLSGALPAQSGSRPVGSEAVVARSLALVLFGALATVVSASMTNVAGHRRQTSQRLGEALRSRSRLAAAANDAEDRERRDIFETIHDTVIQDLSALDQDLGAVAARDPEQLEQARAHLRDVQAQLRDRLGDLHPHVLDHVGLEAALTELVARQAQYGGFSPTLTVDPDAEGIDQKLKKLIYKLARELVVNAAKHARATQLVVELSLDGDGQAIVLRVADDGVGYDRATHAAAVRNNHVGLLIVPERVDALGGTLRTETEPGNGTTVTVRIPVRRERRRWPRFDAAGGQGVDAAGRSPGRPVGTPG